MLFNTIDFAIFLPLVFAIYWFATKQNLTLRNAVLLLASYIFYAWWDWRFLALIIVSTFTDYYIGLALHRTNPDTKTLKRQRTLLLTSSLVINLGILAFFKYFNFFADNFVTLFSFFGREISSSSLNIILPVGISFYTFQTLSYTIDIYRGKIKPTKDLIAFSTFVAFFPQLVAGPIERASNLLPQFRKVQTFDYNQASDGMRQILWGLFKKVVIADNCAVFADYVFSNSDTLPGSSLFLGLIFFAFQIYGDFSGYSDIAIGTARLFGFNLMQNFNFPYFSRDIAEFWRRWHISLSTWFRDYLFIPLGGSRRSKMRTALNILIVFAISGLWHGANYTFIVWGCLNAALYIALLLTGKTRQNTRTIAAGRLLPSLREATGIAFTFIATLLLWTFFRAETIAHALSYLGGLANVSLFSLPVFHEEGKAALTLILVAVFVLIEWAGRNQPFAIAALKTLQRRSLRWTLYALIVAATIIFMHTDVTPFVYFRF